jgi:hypothetical protein
MKITSLLALAAETVDTEESLNVLAIQLRNEVISHPALSKLSLLNADEHFENEGPAVSFELHASLGLNFCFEITPEIRASKFTIRVRLVQMHDGHGESSKDFSTMVLSGVCEEARAAVGDESIHDLIDAVVADIVCMHGSLIEAVGVPSEAAKVFAEQYWNSENLTSN